MQSNNPFLTVFTMLSGLLGRLLNPRHFFVDDSGGCDCDSGGCDSGGCDSGGCDSDSDSSDSGKKTSLFDCSDVSDSSGSDDLSSCSEKGNRSNLSSTLPPAVPRRDPRKNQRRAEELDDDDVGQILGDGDGADGD